MKPNILFVGGPSSCVDVLEGAARETDLLPDVCDTAYHAVERLIGHHYSALVIDLEAAGAENVLRMAHLLPAPERPVVFVMVSPRMPVATAYECGANFVLYKPLQPPQVLRSLRAARGFMPMERRRSQRRSSGRGSANCLVHFDLPGEVCYPAMLLDVNASGISVQTTGAIPLRGSVPFRLQLAPGLPVRGSAELLWTDSSGRAGLMFSRLGAQGRQNIVTWLSSHPANGMRNKPYRVRAASAVSSS
jgi:CheY-like chemotaxis protein